MKNKRSKPTQSSRPVILSAVVVLAILVLGLGALYWSRHTSDNGPSKVVSGVVTAKYVSCGQEILQDDGTILRSGGICDSGNSIVVDGVRVRTGGGSLSANPPNYISDISSVNAGDTVEIRYAFNDYGQPSTDCSRCYVKVISQQKNPQIRVGH